MMTEGNRLYYGDNLDVLRRYVKDESVDLVYLDPPFKSDQDYNVLFAEHGTHSHAQIKAFEDTWQWDQGAAETYEVIGEPKDLEGAQELAHTDPYQFQWWALGLVGARPVEQKKGADKGIDGRLFFHDEAAGRGTTKQIIFSVKSGHTGPAHVRDLRAVLEREKVQIGVLLTLQKPTTQMRTEVSSAGFYESPGWKTMKFPRLQILTVEEILAGKKVSSPPTRHVNTTFKKAPKAKTSSETSGKDLLDLIEENGG